MKMKTTLYSAFLASSLFAQAYDTVFTGGSGANYNWNDPANWSNGVPSESSKVLIELQDLSNNNLVISGKQIRLLSTAATIGTSFTPTTPLSTPQTRTAPER